MAARSDDARAQRHGVAGRSSTGNALPLASGIAWPCGVAVARRWPPVRFRSVAPSGAAIDAAKASRPALALTDPPAYPGRIAPAAKGGYWLTFFSVRNQLVEFILREKDYRQRMIKDVPEPFWMAPSLASLGKFEEPLQGSGLKQMGILKPWAATRSYGLVVRCDERCSRHSAITAAPTGRSTASPRCARNVPICMVAAKGPGRAGAAVGRGRSDRWERSPS